MVGTGLLWETGLGTGVEVSYVNRPIMERLDGTVLRDELW